MKRRRGVAVLWVLVILVILTILIGTITRRHATGRKVLDRRDWQLQAEWLARSGVERAAARLLSGSGDYKGETAALIPGSEVRIAVQSTPGPVRVIEVTSTARFPMEDPKPVTRIERRVFRRVEEKGRVHLQAIPGEPGA